MRHICISTMVDLMQHFLQTHRHPCLSPTGSAVGAVPRGPHRRKKQIPCSFFHHFCNFVGEGFVTSDCGNLDLPLMSHGYEITERGLVRDGWWTLLSNTCRKQSGCTKCAIELVSLLCGWVWEATMLTTLSLSSLWRCWSLSHPFPPLQSWD